MGGVSREGFRSVNLCVPSRRAFLLALGAAMPLGMRAARAQPRPVFASDPFALGVASGYPWPRGVVLWTRLVTDPDAPDGGLESVDFDVDRMAPFRRRLGVRGTA